jgi:hypothetical protein
VSDRPKPFVAPKPFAVRTDVWKYEDGRLRYNAMMGWEHRVSMLTFDAERLIREAYDLGQEDAQRGEQAGPVAELVEAFKECIERVDSDNPPDIRDLVRYDSLLKKYEVKE